MASRHDVLYRHYRKHGGALPFDVWLKHHQQERQPDAIGVPVAFFVAIGSAVVVVLVVGVGVAFHLGRAAGWW